MRSVLAAEDHADALRRAWEAARAAAAEAGRLVADMYVSDGVEPEELDQAAGLYLAARAAETEAYTVYCRSGL